MRIKVLLADDHKIVRGGLRSLLEQESDMDVIADVGDGQAAIELTRELHPSVVVMDISMPGLNGTTATKRILAETRGVKVLALSAHTDRRFVSDMLKAGATGYLPKSCAPEELAKAIREVHAGGIYLSPKVAGVVVEGFVKSDPRLGEAARAPLSDREREVLQLIAEGRSSKEIGVTFHISTRTVDTHRQRLMDKLGIHTIAELTKFALREGLTELED
jgi:DNA-binding NarL/FixJ family response regulator